MFERGSGKNPGAIPEGGASHKEKLGISPPKIISELRALVMRAGSVSDHASIARELRKILFKIHPDASPGSGLKDVVAFDRLTKVATGLLVICRAGTFPRPRDTQQLLEDLTDIGKSYDLRGSHQASDDRGWRAGPGDSEWWPDEESGSGTSSDGSDQEKEKPPYEAVEFEFNSTFVGKVMFEVEIDLEDDVIEFVIDPEKRGDSYGGLRALKCFEIEGVDGVVVAYSESVDEYRGNFGGWKLVKKLVGRRIRGFGTIESFEEFRYDDSYMSDGYDRGTRVRLSEGTIRFGTEASDAYYPHGYCVVGN